MQLSLTERAIWLRFIRSDQFYLSMVDIFVLFNSSTTANIVTSSFVHECNYFEINLNMPVAELNWIHEHLVA